MKKSRSPRSAKSPEVPARDPYRLETVARACHLLKAFSDGDALSLKEVVARTGLNKSIAFRLLRTLENSGLIRGVGGHQYQSNVRLLGSRRYRIGFGAQAEDNPFAVTVTESVRHAAAQEDIDLIILNNSYSANTAVKNARRFIAEGIDLAIEFQVHERAAPLISSLFQEARIPLVAVDIPHPGATFYGVDNYRVGLSAGRFLAHWAKQHWGAAVDEVLMLELEIAGFLPHLRLLGAEEGMRQILPGLGQSCVVHLDTRGDFCQALELTRKHLHRVSKRRTLLAGVNDGSLLGSLSAFEETGRADHCAAVGLGADVSMRTELRRPGSRLIGAIAFFPEQYGNDLIRLALDILRRKPVPPAIHVRHQLVTPINIDCFYPNERLQAGQGKSTPL